MWSTKKILIVIVVLLILTICAGFGVYRNLQEFNARQLGATQEARLALENHDLEAFKKCVDTDKLIELAAKEILTAQINSSITPATYSTAAIQTRYENELKPDFIKSANAALEEYILTGTITYPAAMTNAQEFFKDSGLGTCEIKSITKPQLEGHAKYSTVIFYNRQMKFGFELELELSENLDGVWQISSATGFENYFSGYRRALRKKLDTLNAPIVRQMDEIFAMKKFRAKHTEGDEYGFSETLTILLTADVKSDKPLDKIIGNVVIRGKDGHESFTQFELDMTQAEQGLQTFEINKTLNPFIRADSDAMKHGLKKKNVQIEVTEIIFYDGSSLKLLDKLPE